MHFYPKPRPAAIKIPVHRKVAIAAGLAAAAAACALLASDALAAGKLTVEHALMPVLVGITVTSGHLATTAAREWKLSALGLAVVAVLGTVLTIYLSAGRQVEAREARHLETAAANRLRSEKLAELEQAKKRKSQAEDQAEKEMTGQKCGGRCQDWKTRASEVDAKVRILNAEIERLGAAKPVESRAAAIAELVELVLGWRRDTTARVIALTEPFMLPLVLELASIWLFGYGFGHRRPVAAAANDAAPPAPVSPPPPARRPAPEQPSASEVERRRRMVAEFVTAYEARHGKPPRNSEVMKACGLPKATASRLRREAVAV